MYIHADIHIWSITVPNNIAEHPYKVGYVCLLAAICIGIAVTVFAVMIGEDRTWMPRPDSDKPGWSFGVTVVGGFFAIFSCISMTIYTLVRKWEMLPDKNYGDGHGQRKMVHMVPKV